MGLKIVSTFVDPKQTEGFRSGRECKGKRSGGLLGRRAEAPGVDRGDVNHWVDPGIMKKEF